MNKKIEVFVRHCYHSPNSQIANRFRPEWFDKRNIWNNLQSTINNGLANINIIYDNHFGVNFNYMASDTTMLNIVDCGTEASSFLSTLEIILSKDFSDDTIIYLLEDDYLHKPNWCNVLLEAFTLPVQYVTLYDHLDKYKDYPDLQSKIFVTDSCHWRTVPSTCNTYACTFGQLKQDIDIHRHYSIHNNDGVSNDNAKFLHLRDIGRTLISSIPGYSTHCDAYMSPTVDWGGLV